VIALLHKHQRAQSRRAKWPNAQLPRLTT
jgi:hypothetical protein